MMKRSQPIHPVRNHPLVRWIFRLCQWGCADCGRPVGSAGGPRDGWTLEDGRTVCHACCMEDLRRQIGPLEPKASMSALVRDAWMKGREAGIRECLDTVTALIQPGELEGNGCDPTAERNGLVLAANALEARLHLPHAAL